MKPKNLPRLWCALQGLLPLESCLAAQRGELAWPPEPPSGAQPPGPQPAARQRNGQRTLPVRARVRR
jgi:hypothetical protein